VASSALPVLEYQIETIDRGRWPANRRRAAAVVACVCAIAAGSGYLVGQTGGADRDAAERGGTEAGETAGRTAGLQRGYEVGVSEGEVAGYAAGYRSAYRAARAGASKE
jgi:hypothetical protein